MFSSNPETPMKRIHLQSPLLTKEFSTQDTAKWGEFNLVITDNPLVIPAITEACDATEAVNLDDYVPVCANLPLRQSSCPIVVISHEVKRRPTWLGRGITQNRTEKKPWVGYIHMSAGERQAVSALADPRDVIDAIWRLRDFPMKLMFLTHGTTLVMGGVINTVRYKYRSPEILQKQIYLKVAKQIS